MQVCSRGKYWYLDCAMSEISLLQAMLCHYAFPDCVILAGDAAGLPLCYEDCIALRHHFCYSEWSHIVKQKERGITYKSRGHFRLPDCDKLPRIGLTNNTCTQTGITDMRYDLVTSKILIQTTMPAIIDNSQDLVCGVMGAIIKDL